MASQAGGQQPVQGVPSVLFEHEKAQRSPQGPTTHKITVGHGSVLDAYSQILATEGPVIIGEYCVLQECCRIQNLLPPDENGKPQTMVIGNYNVFGPFSNVNALKVGDTNRFEAHSSVGIMTTVGSGCVFQPWTRVTHDAAVPDATVVFGEHSVWAARQRDDNKESQVVKGVTRWYRTNLSSAKR